MQEYILWSLLLREKWNYTITNHEIVLNIQNNSIKWKFMFFGKNRKKSIHLKLLWPRYTSFKFLLRIKKEKTWCIKQPLLATCPATNKQNCPCPYPFHREIESGPLSRLDLILSLAAATLLSALGALKPTSASPPTLPTPSRTPSPLRPCVSDICLCTWL